MKFSIKYFTSGRLIITYLSVERKVVYYFNYSFNNMNASFSSTGKSNFNGSDYLNLNWMK